MGSMQIFFDPIIETLIANGKGIEINTAGLDKGLKEQHPCTEFIRQYRKKGGEYRHSRLRCTPPGGYWTPFRPRS